MATFRREPNGYIYLYHWINKSPLKVSTKLKIDSSSWNKKRGRPREVNAEYLGINILDEMERYETSLGIALKMHEGASIPVIKHELNKQLAKEVTKEYTDLMEYFFDFKEKIKAECQSNWKSYNTCYNHLQQFQKNKPLPFNVIDMKFYYDFNDYLLSLKLATNTIANQWKLIKAVLSKAYMQGYNNNETFRHFKKVKETSDTIYLSRDELEKMMNLKLKGYLDKARDYFIIGAFTGLRFEDWDRVKQANIKGEMLKIRATKTGEICIIPVHPYVDRILNKYRGELPHKPSNQKMNDYIKKVAEHAKIKDKVEVRITKGGKKLVTTEHKFDLVTTHTARRSLATNLILEGVSPFVVMKITGHKTLSSFERYVRLQELQAMIELKEIRFFRTA